MKRHKTVTRSPLFRIVLAMLLVVSLVGCSSGPDPVDEPASGTILSGYAPKDASRLTIILADTASTVVKLKDTSGTTLLSFYVRSGDTVTVDVPAEMMYVHFASGETWYGEEELFGDDTIYAEDKQLMDFTEYTWEYEFDPMSDGDFEYVEPEDDDAEPEVDDDSYIAELTGQWEDVHLKDGNSSLNVSAQVYSRTVYNCTQMTVNMNVEMNAGTSCKDWQVWGRSGGTFVKIAKVYLAAGNGQTSQTITFSSPVTFDAITITPTAVGGYSWSMGFSLTDIWMQS